MVGSDIKAVILEPGPNGEVHVGTEIDNMLTNEEMLAAAGSLVTDMVTMSKGTLDVENFIYVIRAVYYNGL